MNYEICFAFDFNKRRLPSSFCTNNLVAASGTPGWSLQGQMEES